MNELANANMMTTKEVADALGYKSDTIRKKGKELFSGNIVNGKQTLWSLEQVDAIKQNLTPRTLALKSEVGKAVTPIDIERMTLQVIQYHAQKIKELEQENKKQKIKLIEQAPKVEFYDTVTKSNDLLYVSEVAKIVGYGPLKLFDLLRVQRVFMANNLPYQSFIDAGYFRVVESTWKDDRKESHITKTTKVYQKGVEYISKLVKTEKQYGVIKDTLKPLFEVKEIN